MMSQKLLAKTMMLDDEFRVEGQEEQMEQHVIVLKV
jgi:hypothetical protein